MDCPSIWFCLVLPPDHIQVTHLQQESRHDAAFSLPIRWHMISICLVIEDIHCDPSSKVGTARLLHGEVTRVPFIAGKYLVRRDFVRIPHSPSNLPLEHLCLSAWTYGFLLHPVLPLFLLMLRLSLIGQMELIPEGFPVPWTHPHHFWSTLPLFSVSRYSRLILYFP